MNIYSHSLGTIDNLVYLFANRQHALFIDPAWHAGALLHTLNQHSLTPVGVLLTHSHHDHVSALADILAVFPDLPIYMHRLEAEHPRFDAVSPNIHYLEDGDDIVLEHFTVRVIATPGHTLGSVCFHIDNYLFSGDTLFINGIGRCDFDDSDVEAMFTSLNKLRALPADTRVYPGHDYGTMPNDLLSNQWQTNPYFLIDDKAFFIEMRMRLQSLCHPMPFTAQTREQLNQIKHHYL